jgi:diguanylate cyclase
MIDLSVRSKARVWLGTLAGTLLCIGAALFVDSFNFPNLSPAALRRAITVDILLPTVLAGPLLFLLLGKVRQLAIAQHELEVLASTDSLTTLLNRGAFTMLVEAWLAQVNGTGPSRPGALLIVDADHFKSINDRFGHQVGDAALKRIATSLRRALRPTDLVGRIGGEEFGVFLPGATRKQGLEVGERIRGLVAGMPLAAAGNARLTISIGGVSFRQAVSYDDLFKVADRCLYQAKDEGRDRVCIMDYIGKSAAA